MKTMDTYRLEYREPPDGAFTSEHVAASAICRVLEDLAAAGVEVRHVSGPGIECARCGAARSVQLPERMCDRCRHAGGRP
jgi:hypothetical protein